MLVWVAIRNRIDSGISPCWGPVFPGSVELDGAEEVVSISAEFSIRFRGEFSV